MAFLSHYILLFIAVTATGCHRWEYAFIISLSAAVKDADYVAVIHFTVRTKSCL